MIRHCLALGLLLVLSGAATARTRGYVPLEKRLTPEEIALVGLTPAQVARLDTLLQAAESREAPGSDARGLRDASLADASQYVGLDATPIGAHVRGRVDGWSPGTVFELDNGQQWKVLKGSLQLSKPVEAPAVRLVPGVMGRWFLELDEDHPKARVYRVD